MLNHASKSFKRKPKYLLYIYQDNLSLWSRVLCTKNADLHVQMQKNVHANNLRYFRNLQMQESKLIVLHLPDKYFLKSCNNPSVTKDYISSFLETSVFMLLWLLINTRVIFSVCLSSCMRTCLSRKKCQASVCVLARIYIHSQIMLTTHQATSVGRKKK